MPFSNQLNKAPEAFKNESVAGSNDAIDVGRDFFAAFCAADTADADVDARAAPLVVGLGAAGRGGGTTRFDDGEADLDFRVERSSAWFLGGGGAAAPLMAAFFEAGAFFFFFATRAIAFGLPPPPFRNDTVCSVNKCLDFDKTRRVLIAVGDETAFSREVDVTIVLAPFRKLTFVSSRTFAPLELLELLVLFGFAALFFAFVAPPVPALAVAGGRAEGKDASALLLLVSSPPPPGPCSLRNGVLDSFALVARAAAAAFILGLLRSAFGFFVDGVADDDGNVGDDDDEEADSDKAVILAVILVSDCRLVLPCIASATDAAVAAAAARDFVVPAGLNDEDADNADDDEDADNADGDGDADSTEEGGSDGGSLGFGFGLK